MNYYLIILKFFYYPFSNFVLKPLNDGGVVHPQVSLSLAALILILIKFSVHLAGVLTKGSNGYWLAIIQFPDSHYYKH